MNKWNKYKPVLDVHTHTIVSGHAYNTMDEMIAEAKFEKMLSLFGIADHAPAMPGGPHPYYFSNLPVLKKKKQSFMKTLFGAEANIIRVDERITTDIHEDKQDLEAVDYIIASMHKCCISPENKEKDTEALIKTMELGVNILGHIDDGSYSIDYDTVIQKAKETKTTIEFNNSSQNPFSFRINTKTNGIIVLNLCKKIRVPIILSSDAHCKEDIADFQYLYPLLEETEFPMELVVNDNVDKFEKIVLQKNWKEIE